MGRKGDPKVGFKWTYHAFWGQEDIQAAVLRHVGSVPEQQDRTARCGRTTPTATPTASPGRPQLTAKGYTLSDPGAFEDGLEDYTKVIATFKKDGAEIIAGVALRPDFTNFWTQSKQQGYSPKAVTIGKALQFWQTVASLGDIGYRPYHRRLLDSHLPVQVLAHRRDLPAVRRRLRDQRRESSGSSRSTTTPCSR